MKTRTVFILLFAMVSLAPAEDNTQRLLGVFQAYPLAKVVPVPSKASELDWMRDLWKCVDRALRHPPDPLDKYPHLKNIDLRPDHGYITSPSQYGKGCLLSPELSTIPDIKSGKDIKSFNEYFNLYEKGFTFGGPGQADFLTLKRDPSEPPNWFLLEHQDTGDVLLFQRAEPKQKPASP